MKQATQQAEIEERGCAVLSTSLSSAQLDEIEGMLPSRDEPDGGLRNLLDVPAIGALALSAGLTTAVRELLGDEVQPVRAILFDKTPQANWKVAWHQDVTIAVAERRDVPGFGPWSTKAGVVHAQAPAELLERMISVRLHLDDCGADNGALRVLPGSHRSGIIPESAIAEWRARVREDVCAVPRGGMLVMRPLLLHASSRAVTPARRRVLHIEYSASQLPGGLRWRWPTRAGIAA